MLSPVEALQFKEAVMHCFNNKEFKEQWKRLREITVMNKEACSLFIRDVRDLIWDRV